MGGSLMRLLALAALLVWFSTPALAQSAEQREACRADFIKLCLPYPEHRANGPKCLLEKKEQVSEACRKALGI
jgi:hypothetical protein